MRKSIIQQPEKSAELVQLAQLQNTLIEALKSKIPVDYTEDHEDITFINFVVEALNTFQDAIKRGNGLQTALQLIQKCIDTSISYNEDKTEREKYKPVITDLSNFYNAVSELKENNKSNQENNNLQQFENDTSTNLKNNKQPHTQDYQRTNNFEILALQDTAKNGKYAELAQFIQNPTFSPHLNATDLNGDTLLLLALKANQFQTASLLCFHKEVDLNKSNNAGESPIHVIAQFSLKDIIDERRKKQREKEIVSVMAALFSKPITLKEKETLLFSTYQSKKEMPPLLLATESENLTLVRFLIEQGADPRQTDSEGNTLLHYAVLSRNVEFFRDLMLYLKVQSLRKSELSNIFTHQNSNQETILMLAIQSNNEFLVKYILDQTNCLNEKSHKLVSNLFDSRPRRCIKTALHYAIDKKNVKIVELLVNKNADLTIADEVGKTPLHCAVHADNLEMVKILVEGGASLLQTDKNGETPIQYALNYPDIKIYFDSSPTEKKKEEIIRENNSNSYLQRGLFSNYFKDGKNLPKESKELQDRLKSYNELVNIYLSYPQ